MMGHVEFATRRGSWELVVAIAVACAALSSGRMVAADEIAAKNSTLHGTVTSMTAKGAEIETEFGGKVGVPFADMQRISTDARFHVLYGDDQETLGRILGISNGKLLVGSSPAAAQEVDVATLVFARPEGASLLAGLRSRMRYWSGTADLGFALTQATIDNTMLSAGVNVERDKSPTRLVFTLGGHYGTQKQQRPTVGPETRLADDLRGGARGQYDLTPAVFLWAAGDAKYDGIQRISYRLVPGGGLGYYLYKTDTATLQVESGGSYVYERFFGGSSNSIRGIAFGAEASAKLPYAATFHWRMDYLPSINDWTNTYLLRNDAALLFPIIGAFNFKLGVLDEYDSHPARDPSGRLLAKENSLITTVGVALSF